VAVEIVSAYGGLVRDEAIMRRVNLVGRTLARYSDRPDLDGVSACSPRHVNAFSRPAATSSSPRLYALAADDDQLAAILGHEIVHITERHALEKSWPAASLYPASTNQLAQRSSDVRQAQAQLQQFDLGIGQITKTLFEAGFDPQTEYTPTAKGATWPPRWLCA